MPSRKELLQKEELRQQRQLGLADLEKDAVTGEEIGANVPEMFTDAGWYYNSGKGKGAAGGDSKEGGAGGATLAHQKMKEEDKKDNRKLIDSRLEAKKKASIAAAASSSSSTSVASKPKLGGGLGALLGKKKAVVGTANSNSNTNSQQATANSTRAHASLKEASKHKLTFEEQKDRWAGVQNDEEYFEKYRAQQQKKLAEQGIEVDADAPAEKRRRTEDEGGEARPVANDTVLPAYLKKDSGIDEGTATYDTRTGTLLTAQREMTDEVKTIKEMELFLYKKNQAKVDKEKREELIRRAGPNSGITLKKSDEDNDDLTGPSDLPGAGQSKLLAHGSLALPTLNMLEFQKYKEKQISEEKKLSNRVEALYGVEEKKIEEAQASDKKEDHGSADSDEEVVEF